HNKVMGGVVRPRIQGRSTAIDPMATRPFVVSSAVTTRRGTLYKTGRRLRERLILSSPRVAIRPPARMRTAIAIIHIFDTQVPATVMYGSTLEKTGCHIQGIP